MGNWQLEIRGPDTTGETTQSQTPLLTQLSTNTLIQTLVAKRHNKSSPRVVRPPQAETTGKPVPFPELAGFEKERLELRYTSAYYLAGTRDSQEPHMSMKETHLILPAKLGLSSMTGTASGTEPSVIENFLRKAREQGTSAAPPTMRTIDLGSIAGENDFNRQPAMTHFSRATTNVTENRIKKIEQDIITQGKQLETRLKDTVITSPSKTAVPGLPAGQPGVGLSSLASGVYELILERVKRERRMMGL